MATGDQGYKSEIKSKPWDSGYQNREIIDFQEQKNPLKFKARFEIQCLQKKSGYVITLDQKKKIFKKSRFFLEAGGLRAWAAVQKYKILYSELDRLF